MYPLNVHSMHTSPLQQPGELSPLTSQPHDNPFSSELSFTSMTNHGQGTRASSQRAMLPNLQGFPASGDQNRSSLLFADSSQDPGTYMENATSSPTLIRWVITTTPSEMQMLHSHVRALEYTNQTLLASQQALTSGLQTANEKLQNLETTLHELVAMKPKMADSSLKNVSNQHPKLKAMIHPLFFDLCGVEKTAKQDERIQTLIDNLEPYPDDAPVMKIDHTVNVCFVNKIVDCVWDNETTILGGKPELVDADYNKDVIIKMTKLYWRNLQSQVKARADLLRFEKLQDKQQNSRQCARRSLVANCQHEAIPVFEAKYNVADAVAMIDTNFGSDYISFNNSDLSDASRKCRKDQDIPANGWMKIGLCWRLLDYIVFLVELDSIVKGLHSTAIETNDPSTAPPPKQRKTTKKRDTATKRFTTHPSKMVNKPPQSGKAQPTKPFRSIVQKAWLNANPSVEVLESMAWLQDCHTRAKQGELVAKDREYLRELAEYLAENDGDNDVNL
ncbi:hypothetical protein SERLA73DRAFT_79771 [Serpula lacrymans var. lacrymans S7.3]|uniref:Uncharacterized protein n=2 Tax=Serpula lacrymans var. lacrymans TaxID=341189 RepID=F8QHI6_SERL3|nr:uncharacterized protein SERLADRAFT_434094 [Serpula lacrymans var. lacrymans S7.9]EGN92226.1 hypothetical protein SERLA73DRAFT_79771 [Serpula lacrymans var. lacrymans S7.3]EGO28221.1 hypothetical protein SERLADRAFT_434094 [Serpula lacrymans var. lacrymans S7.9]